MRIAICDDDADMLRQLDNMVADFFRESVNKIPSISTFTDGTLMLKEKSFDIVLLDMEMPVKNGIDIGRELKNRNRDVIIIVITSYLDYLDDAFRLKAFRYITKPVVKSRLHRNLRDACKLYMSVSRNFLVDNGEKTVTVKSGDIIMIEADCHESLVHTLRGDYHSNLTMTEWMTKLDNSRFFSPHRSFIVNMSYIVSFSHDEITLFDEKYVVQIARRRYSEFKRAYLIFLEVSG